MQLQRLIDILENLPAMICLFTPDYHVPYANAAFRKAFGEANGRPCYEYCMGQTSPCEFCETFTVLKTGKPHHWEAPCPGGRIVEAYDVPFTDVDGSPMILEMDLDVTDRKRDEAELARHRDHLEELVKERSTALVDAEKKIAAGQLAAAVAHEINNPLEALGNCLFLARTNPAEADKYLAEAEEQWRRVTGLANQIVDYADKVKPPLAGIRSLDACITS